MLGATELTPTTWHDLEALLIQADLGVAATHTLVAALRQRVKREGLTRYEQLLAALRDELLALLVPHTPDNLDDERLLSVLLIIGTNGSGKTTTIAKIAHRYREQGRKVLLAAADTFRAAAVDQLIVWGERVNVPVLPVNPAVTPARLCNDAIQAAHARNTDLLIIDTAGRLHTNTNLVAELQKISKVAGQGVEGAPHEIWLILDGTTGQNAPGAGYAISKGSWRDGSHTH